MAALFHRVQSACNRLLLLELSDHSLKSTVMAESLFLGRLQLGRWSAAGLTCSAF